ncbi:hypothetical protein GDZ32_11450 [Lactobacillus helveticus]|uniref:Uncharacterized protein n=1 Tax=Lactobacillus helveticus TaxID=1587 RepID=A0A6A7K4S5_LACHE|nr:hypothetical protein [Lactobacillus helveticus]
MKPLVQADITKSDADNKINIERTEAHRFMKVAKELPNVDNWQHLSNRALYTCPIVGQQSNMITLSDNGGRLPICERTQI